ncbi:family 16 glycosylhydrolase [Streptomyces sp. NPDC001508]|uniref:glycoside hydrolase family 16 protein n=1 Tax=Streptomyces sp. NPDC001508 TaxID=3154656 RepID=UPI00332C39FE
MVTRPGKKSVVRPALSIAALLLSLVAFSPTQAATAVTATPVLPADAAAGYGSTPAYADEFDGTALDTNAWYHRITGPYTGGYMTADSVTESNGALHLNFAQRDVTGDGNADYVSGGVISKQRFGYGYYETRAKLYTGTSPLHTSFWSMGLRRDIGGAGGDPAINQDITDGKSPENNQLFEIDGFEADSPDGLDMGNAVQSQGTVRQRMGAKNAAQLGIDFADWNVYGYEYTPATTKFYINGQLKLTIDNAATNYQFNPMNLWLTALPYYPSGTVVPGSSDFDYFRYWNKPIAGANLLGNGSFDALPTSNPGSQIVPGWLESYDTSASSIASDQVVNGTRSLRQGSSSSYTVSTKQNLTDIPNGTYTLTAKVQSSGGQSQAVVRVLNHGGSELSVPVPATSTWTDITIPNVNVTNHAATVAITSVGSAGQWLRADAVSFSHN